MLYFESECLAGEQGLLFSSAFPLLQSNIFRYLEFTEDYVWSTNEVFIWAFWEDYIAIWAQGAAEIENLREGGLFEKKNEAAWMRAIFWAMSRENSIPSSAQSMWRWCCGISIDCIVLLILFCLSNTISE